MRSIVAFAALALTALNFAAASPCKASGTITDSSTVSGIASSSDDLTTTPSDTSPTPSSTSGLVKNAVTNGNFANAGSGSGVPGFPASGTVVMAVGEGYTSDGSSDTNCVKVSAGVATGNAERRDLQLSSFSQEVQGLEVGTSYTVQFAYAVVSVSGAGACSLEASLGGDVFKTLSITVGSSLEWKTTVDQVDATAAAEELKFAVVCQAGGSTVLYVDSIFMSNKVTPATIDDAVLDYGSVSLTTSVVATLSTASTQSTTSAPTTTSPPTTTNSRPATRTLSTGTLTPSATCPGGVVPTPLATCVPRDPVPQAPTTCSAFGVKGYTWWGRARFASPNQNSIEDCAKLCYQQAINCKAFAWYANFNGSPLCALGYDSLAEDGITLGATGSVMWNDLDCYKCDECPTA
ncbi:hypothetical protein QQZ08_009458 [Neonectria magnoliae]|uniref:Apple domain-containing protein n=1 Tax=Neonectria magnoliae TaxID=2732573 RepID=A0ABR1HMN4_9HYPO